LLKQNDSYKSIIGGTMPGIGLMFSGKSGNLAFGMTTLYVDCTDLFKMQVND